MDGSPEKQLWCAVIGRALQDATTDVDLVANVHEKRRLRDDARQWFASNGDDFRLACDGAGYDADVIRMRALRLSSAREETAFEFPWAAAPRTA